MKRTILVIDPQGTVAEQVRNAAAALRPRPDVLEAPFVSAATLLPGMASVDVIVAAAGLEAPDDLATLEALQRDHPAAATILAFGRRPAVPLHSLIRLGAVDLITARPSATVLRESLSRALEISTRRRHGSDSGPSLGKVVTIGSATGGCGKTFFAVNAAYYLHARTKKRTCIIDLDLQFGEVTTALRLQPTLTIFDAHERDASGDADLVEHFEDYLVHHATGVSVLPAPRDPSEADRIDPQDVVRIIDAARRHFDYVIVDTPPALTEAVLAALDMSELLYVLTTLDVPAVRNLGVFLTTLSKLKVPNESIRLVMNKAEEGVGINVEDVAQLFPGGFTGVLPYANVVSRSVNQGEPVLKAFPDAEVSHRLALSLAPLLPEELRTSAPAVVAGAARVRLFDRLLRRPQPATGGAR